MAKSTVTRHSKTPRKPVTIELDPSDVKSAEKPLRSQAGQTAVKSTVQSGAKSIPAAEPVGDNVSKPVQAAAPQDPAKNVQKPQDDKAAEVKPVAAKPAVSPRTESQPVSQLKPQTPPLTAASAGHSGSNSFASGKTMNNASTSASQKTKTSSPWLAGIAGGVIVLLGATALQWSGLLPFAAQSTPDSAASQAAAAQIADLQQQIEAMKTATQPDAALLARLENAEKAAAQAQQQVADLLQAGTTGGSDESGLRSEVAALQEQLKALASRAPAADTALTDTLTERLNTVETRLYTIGSQAEQANAAASSDTDTVRDIKQQLAALQAKIDKQATQPDMAAIIAANALKTAVDRGGSFENEWQTYVSLVPQQKEAAGRLAALAAKGVPTLSQMNTRFSSLADDMVAAVNKPAPDAGVWDQLMGSAKGLIRSRPVGDVTGTDAGAVTARIEFALQNGDAQRAITEWAQLPDAAKQAGQDFYQALTARRDADALLAGLIAATAQEAPAGQPKPAAQ